MRRLVALIIATMAILSIFTLMGCSHEHTYGEWTIETVAGCETEGTMVRVCSE